MRAWGIVTLAVGLAGCDLVLGLDERDGRQWLDGYAYRKQIALTPGVGEDLVDFPVSIALTDPDLARHAGNDGRDLVFSSAADEILPYEIVDYVAATGSLEAWVLVPRVSATAVTELRVYYGGASRPTIETTTWPTDLEAVWHLSVTGFESDSTSNGHGLAGSSTVDQVAGIVGSAHDYDGTEALNSGDPSDGSLDFGMGSFCISTWVRVTNSIGGHDMALYKGGTSMLESGFSVLLGLEDWFFNIGDGAQDLGVTFGDEANLLGNWVHLAAVVDRSVPELRTYTNGAFVAAAPLTIGSVDSPAAFTFGGPPSFPYAGGVDETRVYRRAPSADWIRAEYLNLARRDQFVLIADEEQR